jgi:hypothetical protein
MSTLKRSLFLSPFLVGCYSYTPIETSSAPVGTEVRAHISGAASDRIAPIIGSFNTRVLTGKIDENNAGNMTLEVQSGAVLNTGTAIAPLMQRVPLAQGDVTALEQRRLDVTKTSVFVGAIGAGVALAAYFALNAGGHSDPGPGDPGGPPINRIPVIRFRF